jgi:hypothetical protein
MGERVDWKVIAKKERGGRERADQMGWLVVSTKKKTYGKTKTGESINNSPI